MTMLLQWLHLVEDVSFFFQPSLSYSCFILYFLFLPSIFFFSFFPFTLLSLGVIHISLKMICLMDHHLWKKNPGNRSSVKLNMLQYVHIAKDISQVLCYSEIYQLLQTLTYWKFYIKNFPAIYCSIDDGLPPVTLLKVPFC